MSWMRACNAVVLLLLMVCGGCGSNTTAVTSDSSGPEEMQSIADATADIVQHETVIFKDTFTPEVKVDFVFEDLPAVDTALPEPECEAGEGCFLDQCSENNQCQSGWCVEHMGQNVCTQTCQEECPPGWTCSQVGASDPDVIFICVSNFANLCRPCTSPLDCQGTTGTEDACVAYGDQGAFCGGKCDEDTQCPWGFECQTVTTVDGIELDQCVADTGQCPCTDTAVELGLFTDCQVTNEFGTCQGKRVCTEDGLTDCDAHEPAEETCNGVDDNCNGDVDEGDVVEGIGVCDDGNKCTDDQCLGEDGCENVALSEGECLDNDPCTVADHCEEGVCVGNPVLCDDGNPCTQDQCDGTGGCKFVENSEPCDDGDPCTVADECAAGQCTGVEVPCECQTPEDCLEFEDGDLCNGTLYCNIEEWPYKCMTIPESVAQCEEPAAGPHAICLQAACDPETGLCSLVPDHEGYACDDGDACTVGDKCLAGTCTAGVPSICADNNSCTDDSCDDGLGCVFTDNQLPCEDGNVCTTSDTCTGGQCLPGEPLLCDDENGCTDDTCSPDMGCVFQANDAGCDDGVACTQGDHCADGVCVYQDLESCNDENPCTDNHCDPAQGCVSTVNEALCDDNDVCTSSDHCQMGQCVFEEEMACNDFNECTDDVCDPDQGCVFTVNDATCDDFDACTVGETCIAGICGGALPLLCDDANDCTADSCDPVLGCQFEATCVGWHAITIVPAAFTQQAVEQGTMTIAVGQPGAGLQDSMDISAHVGICPISTVE